MNKLPNMLVMDNEKATRGLLFTPELAEALPSLPQAFRHVDQFQNANREAYLGNVFSSVFSFKHGLGRVTCAAFYNHSATDSKRASLSLPPFTNCAPNRPNAARLADFSNKKSANFIDTLMAAPNSTREIFQAATHNELEYALGDGRPTVAIFSDTPMRVFTWP